MALDRLTQITSSGISSTSTITVSAVAGSITGVVTATSLSVTGSVTTGLDVSGIVTATTVQVGSATTIHTTGIDLGSGNITSHNINSTGIITSTSFVGPVTGNVTGDLTGNVSSSGANTLGSLTVTNDATVGGALTVTGDLTVNGTTTTIDTAVTAVDSLAIDGDASVGGSVGIGTDNPSAPLHIRSSEDRGILIESTDANAYIVFKDTDTSSDFANRVGSISDGLYFSTGGGGERLRIRADGTVYIGPNGSTFSPRGQLHIERALTYSDTNYRNSNLLTIENTTNNQETVQTFIGNYSGSNRYGNIIWTPGSSNDNSYFKFNANIQDVNHLVVRGDGNIGIGTDTPTGRVQIDATSGGRALTVNAPTNGTYITFETNDTPYADIGSEAGTVGSGTNDLLVLNARSTRDLAFRTNSAERLRITSAGYVGIGTNVPTTQLDVRENDTRGAIRIGGDNSTGHRIFIQANGYNGSYIDSYGGDQYRKLKIAASPITLTGGDITLGEFDVTDTRNSGGLHIKHSAGVSFTANSGQSVSRNWRVRNDDHGWGNLDFSVGSSNTTWGDTGADAVLSLTSSKNVGINSTSPTHKLDIVGGVSQQLQITGTEADLWLKSTGPGGTYRILGSTGTNTHRFRIYDETNSLDRLNILSDGKIFFGNNTQTALGSASKDYCDIDAHCSGPMSIGSNGPSTHNTNLKLVGRKIVNWYWYGYVNTGNTYAHLRTSLWGGGSPYGEIDYIMGGFRIEGYQYTGSATSVEYIMFHNWNGALAGYSRYHHGTYNPGNTIYVDSTGYVTIRLVNATYKGFSIDLIQQPWYPVRDIRVTSIINSNSTSV